MGTLFNWRTCMLCTGHENTLTPWCQWRTLFVLWTLWGWGKIKEWNQGTFWPMVYFVYLLIKNLHTHGQYAWAEAPGHILRSPPFSLFSLGSPAQPSPVMIRQCPASDWLLRGRWRGGGFRRFRAEWEEFCFDIFIRKCSEWYKLQVMEL